MIGNKIIINNIIITFAINYLLSFLFRILLKQYISTNESYIFELNVETGGKRELLQKEEKEKICYYNLRYDRKNGDDFIYVCSDYKEEFCKLRKYCISNDNENESIITNDFNWDVDSYIQSKSGNYMIFVINEDGLSKPYLMDLQNNNKLYQIPTPGVGLFFSFRFNPDESAIGFVANTTFTPSDVYEIKIETVLNNGDDNGDDIFTRWTFSEIGGMNTKKFIEPRLIRVKSFDGTLISAWYYPPMKKSNNGGKNSTMIYIHGGPASQFRPRFFAILQYYIVELGMAVICPNVRGSDGYGK